jgi:hypothetical protein
VSVSSSAKTLARAEPLTALLRSAQSRVSWSLAEFCLRGHPHLPIEYRNYSGAKRRMVRAQIAMFSRTTHTHTRECRAALGPLARRHQGDPRQPLNPVGSREGGSRSRFPKRARGGDPRPSGARERR